MFKRILLFIILFSLCVYSSAQDGVCKKIFSGEKGKPGPRNFCKPVMLPKGKVFIWGSPAGTPDKDWTAGAFDLNKNEWIPLPPKGKEDWLKQRPKMRYGMRWGISTYIDKNTGQPVPAAHFNQAAYIPSLKKILYCVGNHTLLFDIKTNSWEKVDTNPQPPMVLWSSLCYDPVNDEVVLFGGGAQNETGRPGTWLFSVKTKSWRKLEQDIDKQPPPRCNAPLAYDSANKLIAVFGGDAQDRFLSDTWIYDCSKREWRELKTNCRPYPRSVPVFCFMEKQGLFMMAGPVWEKNFKRNERNKIKKITGEVWTLDAAKGEWALAGSGFPGGWWVSAVYDSSEDRAILHRSYNRWGGYSKLEFYEWKKGTAPSGQGELAPEKPVYKYHPPEWYLEEKPEDGKKFIKELTPNTWTKLKMERPAFCRTWGTAAIDTDKHEVLYWGGGHCGYCGNDVSHFSLEKLRWETSFPPEFPPSPYSAFYGDESSFLINNRSFKGRPWVQHGRISYVYDPSTKKTAFTQHISRTPTRGFTYIYDNEKREFTDIFPQPFIPGWSVSGINVSTPKGIFNYLQRGDHKSKQIGLFKLDITKREWINLTQGKATVPGSEKDRMVYDSKRDRLVLLADIRVSRKKSEPRMYEWSLASEKGAWTNLKISGDFPPVFGRETVYIEKYDTILNIPYGKKSAVYACDISNGNKWHDTGIASPWGMGANSAVVYDPVLDVLVFLSGGNTAPVNVWLMKYDPKTIKPKPKVKQAKPQQNKKSIPIVPEIDIKTD